jgi:N-acetylmuramoyl-L-alanine amidase
VIKGTTPFGITCSILIILSGGLSGGDVIAQIPDSLMIRGPDGETSSLLLNQSRGYAAIASDALENLGWVVKSNALGFQATTVDGKSVARFFFDNPLFSWNQEMLQFVDVPFHDRGDGYVPLQFVLDFIPARLNEDYLFIPQDGTLEIRDLAVWARIQPKESKHPSSDDNPPQLIPDEAILSASEVSEDNLPEKRVVIIDPGHGGKDPGTLGAGGRREKDIALAVGRELARELRRDESIEVHLTRDRDIFVPLWERGELATNWKGERSGVFISIHANALPNRANVRGFETYFLSEARTEHERRVAANENAPLRMDHGNGEDNDLHFILRELRNLDHQHWSSLLAELVQNELKVVHPGPNRGVKQGPFAVITNALMPAVLVEVGFITNREEERLVSRSDFQVEIAKALTNAIGDFFSRYPPGQTMP